ncbi:hypothetical protein LDENG_00035310, partial [Lucifuga dentata]
IAVHYSSAFHTLFPHTLSSKLQDLGLNTSLCNWVQDFLTWRPQTVRVGSMFSNTLTVKTGAPQHTEFTAVLPLHL